MNAFGEAQTGSVRGKFELELGCLFAQRHLLVHLSLEYQVEFVAATRGLFRGVLDLERGYYCLRNSQGNK